MANIEENEENEKGRSEKYKKDWRPCFVLFLFFVFCFSLLGNNCNLFLVYQLEISTGKNREKWLCLPPPEKKNTCYTPAQLVLEMYFFQHLVLINVLVLLERHVYLNCTFSRLILQAILYFFGLESFSSSESVLQMYFFSSKLSD